jgi:hypothetical protein
VPVVQVAYSCALIKNRPMSKLVQWKLGLCKATDGTQWVLGAVGLVAGGCIESSDAGGLNWMASPLAHAIVMSRCM